MHEGQRLEVVVLNQVLRQVEPKMWPQGRIWIGGSGMGSLSSGGSDGSGSSVCVLTEWEWACRPRLLQRAFASWSMESRGRHVESTRGSCEDADSAVVLVMASGSLHIEQSSGPSRVAASNPRARKSSFDTKGGVEHVV